MASNGDGFSVDQAKASGGEVIGRNSGRHGRMVADPDGAGNVPVLFEGKSEYELLHTDYLSNLPSAPEPDTEELIRLAKGKLEWALVEDDELEATSRIGDDGSGFTWRIHGTAKPGVYTLDKSDYELKASIPEQRGSLAQVIRKAEAAEREAVESAEREAEQEPSAPEAGVRRVAVYLPPGRVEGIRRGDVAYAIADVEGGPLYDRIANSRYGHILTLSPGGAGEGKEWRKFPGECWRCDGPVEVLADVRSPEGTFREGDEARCRCCRAPGEVLVDMGPENQATIRWHDCGDKEEVCEWCQLIEAYDRLQLMDNTNAGGEGDGEKLRKIREIVGAEPSEGTVQAVADSIAGITDLGRERECWRQQAKERSREIDCTRAALSASDNETTEQAAKRVKAELRMVERDCGNAWECIDQIRELIGADRDGDVVEDVREVKAERDSLSGQVEDAKTELGVSDDETLRSATERVRHDADLWKQRADEIARDFSDHITRTTPEGEGEPRRPAFTRAVHGCSRCGADHERVEFHRFARQPDDQITHWGRCPTTGDPILIELNTHRQPEGEREPDKTHFSALGLTHGTHERDGERHREWHFDCGCALHPEDRSGKHGGGPHIHPCPEHTDSELRCAAQAVYERLLKTDWGPQAYDVKRLGEALGWSHWEMVTEHAEHYKPDAQHMNRESVEKNRRQDAPPAGDSRCTCPPNTVGHWADCPESGNPTPAPCGECERLRGRIREMNSKVADLQRQRMKLTEDRDRLQGEVERLEAQLADAEAVNRHGRKMVNAARRQQNEAIEQKRKAEHRAEQAEQRAERLRKGLLALSKAVSSYKCRYEKYGHGSAGRSMAWRDLHRANDEAGLLLFRLPAPPEPGLSEEELWREYGLYVKPCLFPKNEWQVRRRTEPGFSVVKADNLPSRAEALAAARDKGKQEGGDDGE